jgi:hypothetical protein
MNTSIVFKLAGVFGLMVVSTWTVLSAALLVDTGLTGSSEWAPWVAYESRDIVGYMIGYLLMFIIGMMSLYLIIDWLRWHP